jgi:hypothetical protein
MAADPEPSAAETAARDEFAADYRAWLNERGWMHYPTYHEHAEWGRDWGMQHERERQAALNKDRLPACEVCWTWSWAPGPNGPECSMCTMREALEHEREAAEARVAQARAEERARIVAFCRQRDEEIGGGDVFWREVADAIEHGDVIAVVSEGA